MHAIGHSGVMCGRFNVIDTPGLQQLLQDLGIDLALPRAVNVAPTENIALVRIGETGPAVETARWWLTPSWAKEVSQAYSMFNARCENLATSPAFRGPFRRQRALVPMSSFIEWRTENAVKQPWLISNAEQALAVAALWDIWQGGDTPLLSCTLVTTAAAESFKPWHQRMPVILARQEQERWLDNTRAIASDDTMFRSELKMALVLKPLSRAVSNARNKDIADMAGVGDEITLSC
ncbi:MAG: SOS response-associated peptidase [Halioglobus sp.]